MKKLPIVCYLITLMMAIASCKTDSLFLPIHQSSRLDAIATLPANQKIGLQEMQEWHEANLKSSPIQPQWDKPIQTIHNGNHFIEIMTSDDGALFFIKEKGVLTVYVCRWQDKEPGATAFVGSILYYSFLTNKMKVIVYDKKGLVRNIDREVPFSKEVLLAAFMLPNFWNQLGPYIVR